MFFTSRTAEQRNFREFGITQFTIGHSKVPIKNGGNLEVSECYKKEIFGNYKKAI